MSGWEHNEEEWKVGRRNFLKSAAVTGAVGLPGFTDVSSAKPHGMETPKFTIEQGGTEIEVEPIVGDKSVFEFYNPNPSILSTSDADETTDGDGTESEETSTLTLPDIPYSTPDNNSDILLYHGPGGISILFAHDRVPNDSEGKVSFDITGLPEDGRWAVRNHLSRSSDGSTETVEWLWNDDWGAGGAFQGGLNASFQITITPNFEEGIDHWDVVSGSNRTRTSLALNQSITISTEISSFVAQQGDNEYMIRPLSDGQRIEDFYGASPFGQTETGIEKANASQLFFWTDEDGLSLSALNSSNTGRSGSAGFNFSGLSDDGEWVVKDDSSDKYSRSQASWGWLDNDRKGGVFRNPIDTDPDFEITPFIEASVWDRLEVVPERSEPISASDYPERRYYENEFNSGDFIYEPELHSVTEFDELEGITGDCQVLVIPVDEPVDDNPPGKDFKIKLREKEDGTISGTIVVNEETQEKTNNVYFIFQEEFFGGSTLQFVTATTTDSVSLQFNDQTVISDLTATERGKQVSLPSQYSSGVDELLALTGDVEDPFRYILDKDEPIAVRPGALDTSLQPEVKEKIKRRWKLTEASRQSAGKIIGEKRARRELENSTEELTEFLEKNYTAVGGDTLNQFDEAIERMLQVANVTNSAVAAPRPVIRRTVELTSFAIVLIILEKIIPVIRAAKGGSKQIGGTLVQNKTINNHFDEIMLEARRLKNAILSTKHFPRIQYESLTSLIDDFTGRIAKLYQRDEQEFDKYFNELLGLGLLEGYNQGQGDVLKPIAKEIDSFLENFTQIVYQFYLLDNRPDLPTPEFSNTTIEDLIDRVVLSDSLSTSIDNSNERRMEDLERKLRKQRFSRNGRNKRENASADASSYILNTTKKAIETFDYIHDEWEIPIQNNELKAFLMGFIIWAPFKLLAVTGIASFGAAIFIGKIFLEVAIGIGLLLIAVIAAQAIVGWSYIAIMDLTHWTSTYYISNYESFSTE